MFKCVGQKKGNGKDNQMWGPVLSSDLGALKLNMGDLKKVATLAECFVLVGSTT